MLIKNSIIAFLFFFSANIYAQDTWIIDHINFSGLKSFTQNEALKKIMFSTGQKVSQVDIQNSIKSLFNTGNFNNIKVIYSGHTITFQMIERPLISSIIISGNKIISSNVLNQYLDKFHIKKGLYLNHLSIKSFIHELTNLYHELGKYQHKVTILQKISLNNTVDLKIEIYEGDATKINSIKILGNKSFSEKEILSLFSSKDSTPWWQWLRKNIYYSSKLKNDLHILKNFYSNRGYFYFYINQLKIKFSKDKSYVDISINIFEGKQYKISKIFVNGDLKKYNQLIKDTINIHKNDLYNKEKIDLIIYQIRELLASDGYINANVIMYPEINHFNKTMILNFNIDLKNRYSVNKIYFKGNKFTKDIVLRREIKQKEGDIVNLKLIELGKKSLEKTHFFKNVNVLITLTKKSSNNVDIIYLVKEQKTGSVNFSLGYGFDSGLSTNLSFSQDNLFGSGYSIKGKFIKNNNQKYIDFAFLYPHLFFDFIDWNSKIFLSYTKYNFNTLSHVINSTEGLDTNFKFFMNDQNTFNLGFGYTRGKFTDVNSSEKTVTKKMLSDKSLIEDHVVNNFMINSSWIYNNLKYLHFPISGKKISVSGKYTLPFSKNYYFKLMLDREEYLPLNKTNSFIFFTHFFNWYRQWF